MLTNSVISGPKVANFVKIHKNPLYSPKLLSYSIAIAQSVILSHPPIEKTSPSGQYEEV